MSGLPMRLRWPGLALLAAGLLLGCGDADDEQGNTQSPTSDGATPTTTETATAIPTPTAAPTGEGTLAVTFRIDTDWMDFMLEREEQPVGPFWGDIYRGSDVTNLGPNDGAEPLGAIYVESVDLMPDGGPTAVLFVTDPLPNIDVAILGFMDSDGNANPDGPEPDSKDPVTFPADNRFKVIAGQETTVEVFFGLLNP